MVKVTLIVMYANICPPRYRYEFIDKQTRTVIFCPKAVRKYALERIPLAGLLNQRIEHDSRCNFQAPLQFLPPTATHSRLVSDTPDRKTKPITHTYTHTHRQRSKRIAARNSLTTHATHEGRVRFVCFVHAHTHDRQNSDTPFHFHGFAQKTGTRVWSKTYSFSCLVRR